LSKVFVHMGISLDGFVAGLNRGPHNPLGHMGMKVHEKVHEWMFHTRAFRKNLKVGQGGETGPDDDIAAATQEGIGANVIGKRMFDEVSIRVCPALLSLGDVNDKNHRNHLASAGKTREQRS